MPTEYHVLHDLFSCSEYCHILNKVNVVTDFKKGRKGNITTSWQEEDNEVKLHVELYQRV